MHAGRHILMLHTNSQDEGILWDNFRSSPGEASPRGSLRGGAGEAVPHPYLRLPDESGGLGAHGGRFGGRGLCVLPRPLRRGCADLQHLLHPRQS